MNNVRNEKKNAQSKLLSAVDLVKVLFVCKWNINYEKDCFFFFVWNVYGNEYCKWHFDIVENLNKCFVRLVKAH